MIDASVIEKIRKLRAVTEAHGATEDEAIAAQQRMFTLLAKYNLELSEIPDDQPEKPDQSIEADYSDYRETVLWKRQIHHIVAQLNFSTTFNSGQRIVIVGTKANIVATREMAGYLCATIERLANEAAATVPGDQRRRYRHSFALGCSNRVYWRVNELKEQARAGAMKATDPDSLLPALANVYAVAKQRTDAYIAEHVGKLRTSHSRSSVSDYGAFSAGSRAGDGVSLNRQIGTRRSGLLN